LYYPAAAISTPPDLDGDLPLHILIHSFESDDYRGIKSQCDMLRFLLRHYPAAVGITNDEGMTTYAIAVESHLPALVLRLLLRAAPEVDYQELRRLNYIERRGALYLLFAAKFPSNNDEVLITIWQRLRDQGDQQLVKEVVSFL
jgi:hypothetical protein